MTKRTRERADGRSSRKGNGNVAGSNGRDDLSRRTFLKTGVTAAAVAGLPLTTTGGDTPPTPAEPLPRRVLGRTGEKVSILNLGTAQGAANPRMLNAAYDAGVRYIDTADCYLRGRAEKAVGDWMAETGHRKELFVVTKDHPETPDDWVTMVDRRLEALKTEHIDLFFIHNLAPEYHGLVRKNPSEVPKMKTWGAAAEKLKKSGKVRFAGFSTHADVELRIKLLNSAAVGGWVDAIMLAYDPRLV
jgi:predicted aldo/keto reductase-like oxidoreductase